MKPAFSVLTICGLDELESHAGRGVTHVLSIVDPGVAEPLAFTRYGPHVRTTLRFHDAIEPEPGVVLPERADVAAILAWGREAHGRATAAGDDASEIERHMLVHCHMGISRSSAAMTMLLAQAHPAEPESTIVDRIRTIRPVAWPNLRMIGFADEILCRAGRLTAAAGTLYARSLAAKPDLAEVMTRLNRAREVELGRSTPV